MALMTQKIKHPRILQMEHSRTSHIHANEIKSLKCTPDITAHIGLAVRVRTGLGLRLREM